MIDNEYIRFEKIVATPPRKTNIFQVISNHSGDLLGEIKWFGRWRQFCFFPEPGTVWNTGCMASVQAFIAEQMDNRTRSIG